MSIPVWMERRIEQMNAKEFPMPKCYPPMYGERLDKISAINPVLDLLRAPVTGITVIAFMVLVAQRLWSGDLGGMERALIMLMVSMTYRQIIIGQIEGGN